MKPPFLCLSFFALVLVVAVNTSYAKNTRAGWGLFALEFDGHSGNQLTLQSEKFDTWRNYTIALQLYLSAEGKGTMRPIAVKQGSEEGFHNREQVELLWYVDEQNKLVFQMGCTVGVGIDITSPMEIPHEEWVSVAVLVNSKESSASLYVNGAEVTTGSWSKKCIVKGINGPYRSRTSLESELIPRKLGGELIVGFYSPSADEKFMFSGKVDEIRMYNRVVQPTTYAKELLEEKMEHLIVYFALNEGKGFETSSPWPLQNSKAAATGSLSSEDMWVASGLHVAYPFIHTFSELSEVAVTLYGINLDDTSEKVHFLIEKLPANGELIDSDSGVLLEAGDYVHSSKSSFPTVVYRPDGPETAFDRFFFSTNEGDSVAIMLLKSNPLAPAKRGILEPGCDGIAGSGKEEDSCGVCGGINDLCAGCDGIANSGKVEDECGVCGGNGASCADCNGVPNGPNPPNECGWCPGDAEDPLFCLDCNGCPFGGLVMDECGVCGGDNTACLGCDKDPNGLSRDSCGVCGGENTDCVADDCPVPLGLVDDCGECGGDDSSCTCVFYKDFHRARLDCALIEFSLSNSVALIDTIIKELWQTSKSFKHYRLGHNNRIMCDQIRQLGDFLDDCVTPFCASASDIVATIEEFTFN